MTSAYNDAENNVERRKTRSARANYLACQQPLYGPKKRRGLWWGAEDVQSQLDGVARKKAIFEKIASSLANHGYHRTWQQCKTKIKNMTSTLYKYRISLNTHPGVYFFQDIVDPALKRGRHINGAGVYFLLTGLGARYFNYYFNYYYGEPRIFR